MTKTAIITGASRGIGAAIARELAVNGWDVVINYHKSAREAEKLAAETGGRAIMADVSDYTQVCAMFDKAGHAQLLVNNAGIAHYGLFTDTGPEAWRRVFSVNADGTYNCCHRALPEMVRQKHGVIVNISSVWGMRGASCEAAYSASKAAVIGLTRALSKELAPSGIRVNCIAPGVIDTDMLAGFTRDDRLRLIHDTPLGRLGAPEDVARLVVFLASGAAQFITGQVIGVDGGY